MSTSKARKSFTYTLTGDEQQRLIEILEKIPHESCSVPHTLSAVKLEGCTVNLYTSGKLLVQGKQARDWVQFTLEPLVLQRAEVGYENILDPDRIRPHMGVDESGKGDFFGPLVTASVYVDENLVKLFDNLGVQDSKKITGEKRTMDLAREIHGALQGRFSVITMNPPAYNRLHKKMRNTNRILAWCHARAIENLLEKQPDCPRAISDQFGPKQRIESALMERGRKIELIQKPRAESDPAVAAASILARAGFLHSMKKLEERMDTPLPKGASAAVRKAAVELVRKKGPTVLFEVAKTHFRTTLQVLTEAGHPPDPALTEASS